MSARIHDLLEIDAERFLQRQPSAPGWAADSLRETPFVVVRRGSTEQGIPVGVRGPRRSDRWAGVCHPDIVRAIVTPPMLLRRVSQIDRANQIDGASQNDSAGQIHPASRITSSTSPTPVVRAPSAPRIAAIPALRSLPLLAERWQKLGLPWGPGGSVGFELTTGHQVTTPQSDLDVVIYADTPITAAAAQALRDDAQAFPAAVDIRVETPTSGFSLTEYASRSPAPILIRHASGTLLAADPWAIPR